MKLFPVLIGSLYCPCPLLLAREITLVSIFRDTQLITVVVLLTWRKLIIKTRLETQKVIVEPAQTNGRIN